MDGSALYESVAVIFIAQLNGRDLSFVELMVAVTTTVLASIGAAAVPGIIKFFCIRSILVVKYSMNVFVVRSTLRKRIFPRIFHKYCLLKTFFRNRMQKN